MNIAFVGEVDHGKSSLIGRLLLDTKSLPQDKIKELEKISKELGVDACLAFLVDQFIEEREGLLTIDTTEIMLKTKRKPIVCIDTPGHDRFLKNMMTGTSHANAAVIVIDALQGVQEQTLKHAQILEMFGIKLIIFAVNKIDLVNCDEKPFRLIEHAIETMCEKIGITPQAVIPVSAQQGINITHNSNKTKWYKGTPLLSALNHLKEPAPAQNQPLRFPVQDIYHIDGQSIIVGKLAAGTIHKNQEAILSPSMNTIRIEDIKVFGQHKTSAKYGDNIGIVCSPAIKIKRGDVICDAADPLPAAHQFQAQVLWLANEGLKENDSVIVQIATQEFPCKVKSMGQTINPSAFEIILETALPVAVEPFAKNKELGRFAIEGHGRRSGAGIITRTLGILILSMSFLWADALTRDASAQGNEKDPSSFLQSLMQLNNTTRWRKLTATKKNPPATDAHDLKELQALSYLQGYNPPSQFKNVTLYDRDKSFEGYNLFLSAHAPQAILMDMTGKTVHQWEFHCASLPVPKEFCTDYWVKARILDNGDLLALIPYVGLLKIDKHSRLIWFTKMVCHHDLDLDHQGNIYTLTVKNSTLKDGTNIKIDSLVKLSSNGKILKEISFYDLFMKYPDPTYIQRVNKMGHLTNSFFTNQGFEFPLFISGDAFHSNSVQVLDGQWSSKLGAFKKDNLLINFRRLGVVISIDPKKEKIEWLMDAVFWDVGQHFAKLLDNGNILIFDNYYTRNLSRVVEFDPVLKKIAWDYSNAEGKFYSNIAGQCYRLPNGNTLITESTKGRSFEVTPDKKIVWEFYNPNQVGDDKKLIAIIYQMQRVSVDSTLNWLKD